MHDYEEAVAGWWRVDLPGAGVVDLEFDFHGNFFCGFDFDQMDRTDLGEAAALG